MEIIFICDKLDIYVFDWLITRILTINDFFLLETENIKFLKRDFHHFFLFFMIFILIYP